MDATIAEVRRLSAGWRHLPPIEVVPSAAALPGPPAPSDAMGMYLGGEVFVVDGPYAAPVWARETLGHHAPRALLGSSWRNFMQAVQAGATQGDPLLAKLREHVRTVYLDADGRTYLTARQEADEVMARLAEVSLNIESGELDTANATRKRLLALVGQFGREGLLMDIPANGAELEGALLNAQEYLRNGVPFGPLGSWCYPAAVNKPMGPARPARSVQESERMIRADQARTSGPGWRDGLALWAMGLGLVAFMGVMAYIAFATAIGMAGPIFGSILALVFLWFIWFRKS